MNTDGDSHQTNDIQKPVRLLDGPERPIKRRNEVAGGSEHLNTEVLGKTAPDLGNV